MHKPRPPKSTCLTRCSPAFRFSAACAKHRAYLAYNETMDFSLNDHQKLIRDTVRQFMEAVVRPFVKEWEKQGKFPVGAIRKLGEMGCRDAGGPTGRRQW